MKITKNEIRQIYKEKRRSVINKKDKSVSICKKIIALENFDDIKVVAFYSAMSDEVDLSFLFDFLKSKNIITCFPKVLTNGDMEFYRVDNLSELKAGSFGIKEPVTLNEIPPLMIDLMIVPLLVFDNDFNRVGYGKGYYDKYFSRGGTYKKIGVAYEEQRHSSLSDVVNDNDVPLDVVYSD